MIQEEKITYYAENMAKELCEMPSFGLENVATMLKSRIRIMMHDVLNDQVSELEQRRALMVEEYSSDKVPAWRKRELNPQIAAINVELKKAHKNSQSLRIQREYELLKKLCIEKLPAQFMEDYFELQKQVR